MSYKDPNNKEKEIKVSLRDKKKNSSIFAISDKYLDFSIGLSTLTFAFVIIFFINTKLLVEQSDVQTAMQVSAGLAAISLAINPFFKDFKIQKTLLISFLILACVFLLSTGLGFIAMLFQHEDPQEVIFTMLGVILIVIVVCSHGMTSFNSLKIRIKNDKNQEQKITQPKCENIKRLLISPTRPLDFLFIFILALVCILFSNSYTGAFLIMFSYAFFLLIATMIAMIISVYFDNKKQYIEKFEILKKDIENVLNHKKKELELKELLFFLRKGPYKTNYDNINENIVRMAAEEMDQEMDEDKPKATYFNRIIEPRWNNSLEQLAIESSPSILVFKKNFMIDEIIKNNGSYTLYNSKCSQLLKTISKSSKISENLLINSYFLHILFERLVLIEDLFENKNVAYDKEKLQTIIQEKNMISANKERLDELVWSRYKGEDKNKIFECFLESLSE